MKKTSNHFIQEYIQIGQSTGVAKGYKEIMQFLMSLRAFFIKEHQNKLTVGSFHQGYMDMSYFPITTQSLGAEHLKVGVVFNHEQTQFELWLVGRNKKIQKEYWSKLNKVKLGQYKLSNTPQNSIIEHTIIPDPDFRDLSALTHRVEKETIRFISAIEKCF